MDITIYRIFSFFYFIKKLILFMSLYKVNINNQSTINLNSVDLCTDLMSIGHS